MTTFVLGNPDLKPCVPVGTLVAAAHQPRSAKASAQPGVGLAARLVRGPWRRLAHAARALEPNPSDEALHTVRILAKRWRYAAEAVVPVAGERAERFAAAIAQIQIVLGESGHVVVLHRFLGQGGQWPGHVGDNR
ncbi:MAG TPA: CHAD domain-containing protein [Pseudonocardiaceae bacterium]|nr:CHAD domain-containing protein [Pseudonocardiaceae bacterium]